MNTLPEFPRPAAGADHIDVLLLRAIADMRPGWVVLRDCLLADDVRRTRARVRYALLHPKIGIALLDVLPGATTPGAPHRMRQLLDASGFRLAFGDYPPIVYLCVPSRSLSDIAPLLTQEFGVLPPLALAGRDAWVAAAQWALAAAEQPLQISGQMANDGRPEPMGPPGPDRVEGWSAPRQALGLRTLGVFWGAVALAFSGGALVLEYLGPPEAPAAAVADAGTGSGGAWAASEQAWLAPALQGKASPSIPGSLLALWPAERMRTRFGAARAGDAATPLESGDAAALVTRPDGNRSAPIDLLAAAQPPWPQVAAARRDAPLPSIPRVEHDSGSDDVLSTEAVRTPPPTSETESGAPEMASGSEGAPAGEGTPPATVGTAVGAGTAQARGATEDDETPASVSVSGGDAAAAGARDPGPVAPPLRGFGGAAAPAQASVPTAPPGASEVPLVADVHDSPHADPQSAGGPDGLGGADVRLPPAAEPEAAPGASAPSETARAPRASPAQEGSQALVSPTADAHATDLAAASVAETAFPSATATADALPATGPAAIPLTHAEPLLAPVQPAETAVASTAAAASAAQSAAKPQRPPSGASPAAVAALLARGDALIAIGDVATARLVYQRAAAHASGRAATATGKTYDPHFLQAIGAIGVVADPDAAAAWYRRGSALGDEDATPLLGGLEAKASQ